MKKEILVHNADIYPPGECMAIAENTHSLELKSLFFVELVDRFIFYGIQSLLMLYLINYMGYSEKIAYQYFGFYTSLGFMLPILGGYVADHLLDQQCCIVSGLCLMSVGQGLLIHMQVSSFPLSMALLLVGIGLLKPSAASLVGKLYKNNHEKREKAYVIFYIGMNMGVILGPLLLGFLVSYMNWQSAFMVSTIVSAVTCFFFYFKKHIFSSLTPYQSLRLFKASLLVTLLVCFIDMLGTHLSWFNMFFLVSVGIACIGITLTAILQFKKNNVNILCLLVLFFIGILFFSAQLQITSSLLMFLSKFGNFTLLGFDIPPQFFSALEPFFIILCTPFFYWLMVCLRKYSWGTTLFFRFLLALLFSSIGFLFFSLATRLTDHTIYFFSTIVTGVFFISIGELCVAPAIISAINRLAPVHCKVVAMGFWFFSIGIAGFISGQLAAMASTSLTEVSTPISYAHSFNGTLILSISATIAMVLMSKSICRLFNHELLM